MPKSSDRDPKGKTEVLTRPKVKRPPLYRVILHNDDYTTQEFVIEVLQHFFYKTFEEALMLMLAIHHTGKGIGGVYPHDIAVTKIRQIEAHASKCEMPLRLSLEPDE